MLDSTVVLPWWENASRAAADLGSVLAVLACAGFCLLAGGLFSLQSRHSAADRHHLSIELFLAAAFGVALALALINLNGQLVPAGFSWLFQLLVVLALPEILSLLLRLAAVVHAFAPDWSSVKQHGLNGFRATIMFIKLFIKRLRERLAAKKETSI
jgi:hypothetical protein